MPRSTIRPTSSAMAMNSAGEMRPVGVVPARQRLEAGHRAVLEPHDRLVEDGDLFALERPAQVRLERPTVGLARAHRGLEQLDAVAADALGVVHRELGVLEHLLGAVRLAVAEREPGRGGEDQLAVVEGDRRAQLAQRLGQRDDALGSRSDRRMSANWSPARRASVSCGLSSRPSRRASVSRIESPTAMPTESLICLKRSRSITITVGLIAGSALAKASTPSRRSRNSSRLGSPVRLSCTASCRSRSSAFLNSVTSVSVPTSRTTSPSEPTTGAP